MQCQHQAEAMLAPTRLIQISGTQREVDAAKVSTGAASQLPQRACGMRPPCFPLVFPQKLIMEKLVEDAVFRQELAQTTVLRSHRKEPLGSRREALLLPDREHGAGNGGPLRGGAAMEELQDGSEAAEKPAAVPKFEGERFWYCPWVAMRSLCWGGRGFPHLPRPPMLLGCPMGSEGFVALVCSLLPQSGCPTMCPRGDPRVIESQNLLCWKRCLRSSSPTIHPLCLSPAGSYPAVPSPDFSFHADEHLEVYVSAAENPNHFWIQIIGERSLQLDKLISEMTQHYEGSDCVVRLPGGHRSHPLAPPGTGGRGVPCPRRRSWRPCRQGTSWPLHTQTAAIGTGPGCWARWRTATWTSTMWILGTTGRRPVRLCEYCGECGRKGRGGSGAGGMSPGGQRAAQQGHEAGFGLPPPSACCFLSTRSDFLSLPFQAIECSLAGIVPVGECRRSTGGS